MHTAIVLLSLGLAVAVATGALADHAELITNRNLAAERAERAAAAFVDACGSRGCEAAAVNSTRRRGTALSGCLSGDAAAAVLRVQATVAWSPRVFTGLAPAQAISVVDLGGFSASAATVLKRC